MNDCQQAVGWGDTALHAGLSSLLARSVVLKVWYPEQQHHWEHVRKQILESHPRASASKIQGAGLGSGAGGSSNLLQQALWAILMHREV